MTRSRWETALLSRAVLVFARLDRRARSSNSPICGGVKGAAKRFVRPSSVNTRSLLATTSSPSLSVIFADSPRRPCPRTCTVTGNSSLAKATSWRVKRFRTMMSRGEVIPTP